MTNVLSLPARTGTPAPAGPPVDDIVAVQLLAVRWPVGDRVRHGHSMWKGTVVPGSPLDCPGAFIGVAPAHCLLPADGGREPGLVCVQWDHPDTQPGADTREPYPVIWPNRVIGPAWMRPGVLRPIRRGEDK